MSAGDGVKARFLVFKGISVFNTWIRNLTVCEQLHQEYTVRPHIRFDRKVTVYDSFRSGPFHRESGTCIAEINALKDHVN